MPFIRSISGLRATLGDSLLPETVSRYASAFAQFCPAGKIIIGRDGRPSGEWIEQILVETFKDCKREFLLLGVVPTPTVQFMVEETKAAGGIVITASHNPAQWNGLKFLNSTGVFLDKSENENLWQIVDKIFLDSDNEKNSYKPEYNTDSIELHIAKILNLPFFHDTDILRRIRGNRFKVVVDAVNSSGSVAIISLLASMGCERIPLYCDGTGLFPHTPEPLAENLTALAEAVKLHQADIGIAVDPDADRLVLIDETGKAIGEEKTISLAVLTVLENIQFFCNSDSPAIVVNYSTTRLVEDIAVRFNAKVHRSPVGEINVVKKMKETDAFIGGEGSGGVILPACHYGRDSLVGTALIMSLLAQKKATLSSIVNSLHQYQMVKYKQEYSGSLDSIIPKVILEFEDARITNEDGIRIDFPKSWVQLRSSNTEPIIRIIAEAETKEEAEELVKKVLGFIK